jgi:myo-inositol-1-phosphate synthase
VVAGARAIARGASEATGLTTAQPPFSEMGLADIADLCFGGAEINDRPLAESIAALHARSRTLDHERLELIQPDVAAVETDILRLPDAGDLSLPALIDRLRAAIRVFREGHDLARVIVVNLISAGPEPEPSTQHETLAGLEALIASDRREFVTPSLCYAYAALREGCPYINFTPNPGTEFGAIAELATQTGLPFYGDDGKTGETLVKTALAPMFSARNLKVLSWEGVNLLGNADGRALDDPLNRQAKLRNKEQVLASILGYAPHAGVSINYVPSLGDWKTAWDLIHFQGFLDVPMTMQFTWQGCDSILAAPLVLDLVRLADFAQRRGEQGHMTQLACFFKHPLGVDEMALPRQLDMLQEYALHHVERG